MVLLIIRETISLGHIDLAGAFVYTNNGSIQAGMCLLELDTGLKLAAGSKRSRSRSLAEPHELGEQHPDAAECDRFQTARGDKRLRLAADSHK